MKYKIYWYDDAQTIIVVRPLETYAWKDVYQVFEHVNLEIASVEHEVTTIYDIGEHPLPKNAMRAIQIGISMQLENEKLIILVTDNNVLASLINTVSNLYGLKRLTAKYRYVKTFEEAIALAQAE